MDRQKKATAIVALIALLVVGWSFLQSMPDTFGESPIVVYHSEADGVHTYTGTVPMPNPCATLTSGMGVVGQKPPRIKLQFEQKDTGVCPTTEPSVTQFLVSFASASGEVPQLASVAMNGASTQYLVVESN